MACVRSMKPDWKDAPDWANWLAQDADGIWGWFSSMPDAMDTCWVGLGKWAECVYTDGRNPNWRDTLEQPP